MGIKINFRTRGKTPNSYANLSRFLIMFYKRKWKLYNERISALKNSLILRNRGIIDFWITMCHFC